MYIYIYIHIYSSGRKVGRRQLERLMRQRHLPTLGLSWSHLPTLGPGIWTGSCGNGIFQLSVCGKQLKYCRQRETAITTTAPVLQREKLQLLQPLRYCRKRELASTTTALVLQREKLHLLRPPQYCKKRETIIAATLPAWQTERNCKSYDRSIVAETEKLQLLRPLQIKSWKAANLEESKVGRCVVFQPRVLEFWVRIFQLCGCHHIYIYISIHILHTHIHIMLIPQRRPETVVVMMIASAVLAEEEGAQHLLRGLSSDQG